MTPNPTRKQIFLLAEKAGFKFVGEDRNETPYVIGPDDCAEQLIGFAVLCMDLKQPQITEWHQACETLKADIEQRRIRYYEQDGIKEQLIKFEKKSRKALDRLAHLIDKVTE